MTNPQSQISGGGDRPEDTNDDAQGLGQAQVNTAGTDDLLEDRKSVV